jgi:hypothetical protein
MRLKDAPARTVTWLEQTFLIIDANYKRHREELQEGPWHNQSADLRTAQG